MGWQRCGRHERCGGRHQADCEGVRRKVLRRARRGRPVALGFGARVSCRSTSDTHSETRLRANDCLGPRSVRSSSQKSSRAPCLTAFDLDCQQVAARGAVARVTCGMVEGSPARGFVQGSRPRSAPARPSGSARLHPGARPGGAGGPHAPSGSRHGTFMTWLAVGLDSVILRSGLRACMSWRVVPRLRATHQKATSVDCTV